MGEIIWSAYEPEDINWEARGRVEAYTRQEKDPPSNFKARQSTGIGSGLLFMAGMAALLVAAYMVLSV